eukprot:CAMPEP_0178995692 /NCGR_PEP_ID=MMETSP0795-20121207/7955_1 /TAXON_ID=88552 /ORGANISM="Amoebophrya sp., Strain Ameob2" /LENGTH=704 /DNA_ID=CAMNT_0020688001 /DNA_START=84 /DNA_END=2198 /DNA_ORIENTATION=+
MTGKVKVVVRVRPTANFASNVYKFDEGTDAIDIIHAADASHGAVNNTPENWHFKVDKLIVNATQETVFGTACDEIIRGVMEGYNGTVLAYGQTGAGKTFTISGGNGFAQRGLVPRAISRTFAEIHSRPENIISVRLSYIEIYNELMFDLLSRTPVKDQKGDLLVQEGPKGEIICRQLMVKQAPSEEMALNIFFEGDAQKALAEHALNEASSRSHTILTIYVDSRSRVESSEKITSSKFHLVDLAGSERLKKTNSEGGTLKEAGFINKSLTFLEQVVRALADKARDHVPYRQSKLTHFLKDSLGGNCKTTMIANVYPEARFLEESGSTLRFATSMMKVVNKPNVNVHMDQGLLLKKYERDIKDLKQELAMHDTGRGRIQYADFSPDEIRALETKIKTYVEGDVETLEIVSLKMVQESFGIFRKMIQNLQKELRERPTMLSQAVSERTATMEDGGPVGDLAPPEDQVGVDDDATNGFGIGVATTKPMDDVEAGTAGGEGDREGEVLTPRRPHKAKKEAALGPADKASVFLQWKKKEGGSFERVFQNLKSQVMQRKQECKMLIQQLNAKKQAVDALDARISQRASSSAQQGDLIDEEEFALLSTKQTERTQHRKLLEEKRMLDQAIVQGEQQMQACKRELVQAFEAWYSAKYETGGNATTNSPIAAVSTLDSKEQYDGLEAQRFGGDDEAYTFYKARRNAKTMKSRK